MQIKGFVMPSCNIEEVNSFTDSRDGNVYKTVKIGNQVWLAENFRYSCKGSYAYDDDESNVKKYGRLYTWDAAMKSAPAGWHLPTKEEFDELERWVDAHTDCEVGTALKSTTDDWILEGVHILGFAVEGIPGTDEFGFSTLPAGFRHPLGHYGSLGYSAYFWTASESSEGDTYYRYLYCDDDDFCENWSSKAYARSIRLLRDLPR